MKDYSNLTPEEFDALTAEELVEYLSQSGVAPLTDDSAPATEAVEEEETSAVAPVAPIVSVSEETPAVDADVFGAIPATDKIEEALTFGGLDFDVETFPIKPVIAGLEDGS